MISHEKLATYFDLLLVIGGILYVMVRFGQMRLPIRKGHPAILLMQLVITFHFFLQLGLMADKPKEAFMFYTYLLCCVASAVGVLLAIRVFEKASSSIS